MQLCSARSAEDYDALDGELRNAFQIVAAPPDVCERVLELQRDLAHRTPIPDLVIVCTPLHHGLGFLHVDRDFERVAEVRPLVVRRLA